MQQRGESTESITLRFRFQSNQLRSHSVSYLVHSYGPSYANYANDVACDSAGWLNAINQRFS